MTAAAPAPRPHYSENPSAFPLDGGCGCGRVRYRLERPPLVVHCCHCTRCQREAGSAFNLNAMVEADAVTGLPSAPPTSPSYAGRPDEFPACGPHPVDRKFAADAPPTEKSEPGSESAQVVEPVLMTMPSESGFGQEVARCPTCGVMVWSYYPSTGRTLRYVRVATLDKAWKVNPDVHIYARSKRDFVTLAPDGIPVYEEFYPSRKDMYRKESLQRFENILPIINKERRENGLSELKI